MRKNTRCFLSIVAAGVALMTPIRMTFADSDDKAATESPLSNIKCSVVAMGTVDSCLR